MALRLSSELEDKIIALYSSGLTINKVSESIGIDTSTIIRVFKRRGYKTRPRNQNRAGSLNGNWKNGFRIINGYVHRYIPDNHPLVQYRKSDKSIVEHRLVMMEHLQRPLYSWETVHHIDGNKKNNAIDNLQLIVGNHGTGIALCCANCGSTNLVPVERLNGN